MWMVTGTEEGRVLVYPSDARTDRPASPTVRPAGAASEQGTAASGPSGTGAGRTP